MKSPNKEVIINFVYRTAVLSGVLIGYSYLLKRFFKFKICEPNDSVILNYIKMTGVVAASSMTVDYLGEKGIILKNPLK